MIVVEEPLGMPGGLDLFKQGNVSELNMLDGNASLHTLGGQYASGHKTTQEHIQSLHLSLSFSTASSDSLVTAISKFPPVPPKCAAVLPPMTLSMSGEGKHEHTSSNGSSSDSVDTLIASRASLGTQRPPSSCSSFKTSYDYPCVEGEKIPVLEQPMSNDLDADCVVELTQWHIQLDESNDFSEEEDMSMDFPFRLPLRTYPLPDSTDVLLHDASPDRLGTLSHEFETKLSDYRLAADSLAQELELYMLSERTKLDLLLLRSIRRASGTATEAMAMVSWFRENKLGRARCSSSEQTAHQSSEDAIDTTDTGAVQRQAQAIRPSSQPAYETSEPAPRNGFEALSRDHLLFSGQRSKSEPPEGVPQVSEQVEAARQIELLAKSRSATPLHFNRPSSPFVASKRRWKAQTNTSSDAQTRGRTLSNAALSSQSQVRQGASSPVANTVSSEVPPMALIRGSSDTDTKVQFPSTDPSPLPSIDQHDTASRQSTPSLKSFRKLKLSLRPGKNDARATLTTDTAESSPVASHKEHQSPSLPHASESSRAVTLSSARPLSLAASAAAHTTRHPPLPATRLAELVKPFTPLRRKPVLPVSTATEVVETQPHRAKLTLKSLWRALSLTDH